MNTYRINYSIGGEEVESTELTERNETAARKMFKTFCKSGTITSIELTRENVCATKQQERDTLAAIMQMVEELGPQSYLKTAFAGCFEIAEWNIDADAADSLKGRLEMAEGKISQGVEELHQARKDLGTARAEIERLKAERDELARRIPTADDLSDVLQLLTGKVLDLGKEVANAAERIVEAAGQPESAAFQNALKDHRAAKADLEYYTALLARVNNIVTAGA